jgi:glycosyltransferase involved in cell wall biosynthesis
MARAHRRVCFVLPSLAGGGAERAAVHVLNALDGDSWDRWLYLFRREGPYLHDVSDAVHLESGASGSKLARVNRLRRFIRSTRPDLVVSFLSYFSVLAAARLACVGTRVVFNQQTPMSAFLDDRDYHWRRPWDRRLFGMVTRFGYRLADAIVTTSRGVADDIIQRFGVRGSHVRVVHNPVDVQTVRAKAAEPIDDVHAARWRRPVIVAAGRLADAKNYPLLIDAMQVLRKKRPACLFVLGTGDREAELRALVASRGLDDAVTFCGFQANPWRYIARAEVFALSSRYEGFGNVLLEAMACGVPVVATTSPGTRDIVRDGENGLLVDQHDPASLASALDRLLGDDALRQRMSEQARRSVQPFALAAVAAEYDRVFGEVLA